MQISQGRRDFLATLSALGAASFIGGRGVLAGEGPPETTTIRIRRDPSICVAPQYIAEDLLRAEGFKDIRYVPAQSGPIQAQMLTRGELDSRSLVRKPSSPSWMPACRSRRWRACMPDASSCSRTNRFTRSVI